MKNISIILLSIGALADLVAIINVDINRLKNLFFVPDLILLGILIFLFFEFDKKNAIIEKNSSLIKENSSKTKKNQSLINENSSKINEINTNKKNTPVSEDLSPDQVFEGIDDLVEKIKNTFIPHYIVGINRGGAIVGGMIAKRLNIDYIDLVKVSCKDDNPLSCEIDNNFSSLEFKEKRCKVLLVDDALRKGNHMKRVEEHFNKNHKNVDFRKAVLLFMKIEDQSNTGSVVKVDYYGRFTEKSSVVCPWDYKDSIATTI